MVKQMQVSVLDGASSMGVLPISIPIVPTHHGAGYILRCVRVVRWVASVNWRTWDRHLGVDFTQGKQAHGHRAVVLCVLEGQCPLEP